jgi:CheY-like chemotaxis protein
MTGRGGSRPGSGRPKLPASLKKRQFTARFSGEVLEELQAHAAQLGQPVTEVLEALVARSLPQASPTVLVVEDNPLSAELLSDRLASMGCRALVASDVDGALAIARDAQPRMVLLDLKLGAELHGIDVLLRLRSDARTAAIPVVIHSAWASGPEDLPADAASADGYLPKPGRYDDLYQLVSNVIQPASSPPIGPTGSNAAPGRK